MKIESQPELKIVRPNIARRGLFFVLIFILTSGAHVHHSPGGDGGGSTTSCNGAASGSICVDYSETAGTFPPVSPYLSVPGIINGPQMDGEVRNLGIRYQRLFYGAPIWSCGPGCYNFTADDSAYRAYGWGDDNLINIVLNEGAVPLLNIGGVPSWLNSNVNGPPNNYNQYTQMWIAALYHIANTYPNITLLEAFNEPEYGGISSTDVNNMYDSLVYAVQQVNASLGYQQFLIGGPTAANVNSGVLQNFLSYVTANNLEFDFVTWHSYDGNVGGEAKQVQNILASYGFDPDLPQMVTEWGFDSSGGVPLNNYDAAIDAVSAVQGWEALLSEGLGGIVQPFFFSPLNCYIGDPNESLFVTGGNPPDGNTCPGPDGPVMPMYNAFQMMSMQKTTLVSYNGINDQVGLSPIASVDGTGVALLIANPNGGNVNINMINLPSAFQSGPFTSAVYLVDTNTSNYAYDTSNNGALQQVSGGNNPAGTSFNMTVTMNAAAVLLVVLTP